MEHRSPKRIKKLGYLLLTFVIKVSNEPTALSIFYLQWFLWFCGFCFTFKGHFLLSLLRYTCHNYGLTPPIYPRLLKICPLNPTCVLPEFPAVYWLFLSLKVQGSASLQTKTSDLIPSLRVSKEASISISTLWHCLRWYFLCPLQPNEFLPSSPVTEHRLLFWAT